MRRTVCMAAGSAALALGMVLGASGGARGSLETPGFRAVGVAHSAYPISALALAPDGRLFAAVQMLDEQKSDPLTPLPAEIRVYQGYKTADGSTLDKGTTWATLDLAFELRATKGVTFKVLGGLDLVAKGGTYTCQMTTYHFFDPSTTSDCGAGKAGGAPYLGVAFGFTP